MAPALLDDLRLSRVDRMLTRKQADLSRALEELHSLRHGCSSQEPQQTDGSGLYRRRDREQLDALTHDPYWSRDSASASTAASRSAPPTDAHRGDASADVSSLSLMDLQFHTSVAPPATLMLMSAACMLAGLTMFYEHDPDDLLTARSLGRRAELCRNLFWFQALHMLLLGALHQFGPLQWKRLLFAVGSHVLWILQYRVLTQYIDFPMLERRFDLLLSALYTVFQVGIGWYVIKGPRVREWFGLTLVEAVACLSLLDLAPERADQAVLRSKGEVILFWVGLIGVACLLLHLGSPTCYDSVLMRLHQLEAESVGNVREKERLRALIHELERVKQFEQLTAAKSRRLHFARGRRQKAAHGMPPILEGASPPKMRPAEDRGATTSEACTPTGRPSSFERCRSNARS
jgi:hypothetical protein